MNAKEVAGSIRQLAGRIGVPETLVPGTVPSGWGAPHIEVDGRYHFVVCERGLELERRSTSDLDELLYWVFGSATFSMAVDFEVAHRRDHEDARRQVFDRQRELLIKLNPDWAIRRDREVAEILANHPFNDAL